MGVATLKTVQNFKNIQNYRYDKRQAKA